MMTSNVDNDDDADVDGDDDDNDQFVVMPASLEARHPLFTHISFLFFELV